MYFDFPGPEEFEVLDHEYYPSPASWSDPGVSDCSIERDTMEPQLPPNFWNDETWVMPVAHDSDFRVTLSFNRALWPPPFNPATVDMTINTPAQTISVPSILPSQPTSATAPDQPWTMDPKMDFLTRVALEEFDQPGQGHDPTRKRKTPSDEEEEDAEDEEEEEDEDEEDGDEEEEDDGDLDDDGSGLYQEHHAEIKTEQGRERSDSSATRRPTGNNPYGSRGCESCMACRRRKGKCIYANKDEACQFCARMNHQCGPKVTKVEFQTIQNGKPCPQIRISEIAKELERDHPLTDPRELYIILGQRLDEIEQKRKQLQSEVPHSSVSPASSTPRSEKLVRGKPDKRRRSG